MTGKKRRTADLDDLIRMSFADDITPETETMLRREIDASRRRRWIVRSPAVTPLFAFWTMQRVAAALLSTALLVLGATRQFTGTAFASDQSIQAWRTRIRALTALRETPEMTAEVRYTVAGAKLHGTVCWTADGRTRVRIEDATHASEWSLQLARERVRVIPPTPIREPESNPADDAEVDLGPLRGFLTPDRIGILLDGEWEALPRQEDGFALFSVRSVRGDEEISVAIDRHSGLLTRISISDTTTVDLGLRKTSHSVSLMGHLRSSQR